MSGPEPSSSKRPKTYDKAPLPSKTRLLLYFACQGEVKKDQPSLNASLAAAIGCGTSQVYDDLPDLQHDELIADVEKDDGTHIYVVTKKGYDTIRHLFRSPLMYGIEVITAASILLLFGFMAMMGTLEGFPLAVGILAVSAISFFFGINMMWMPVRLSKFRKSTS